MNKILEKLGLYDLTVLLLTGMIITTLTVIILEYVFQFNEAGELFQVSETVLFLVISYFIGLVFQEIGSIAQKHIIHRNNGVLKRALKASYNSHYLLSEIEIKKINDFVKDKLQLDNIRGQESVVYNYCKSGLMQNGDMTKVDRDQYISSMSRSLSVYFGLIFIFTLGKNNIRV